LIAIHDVDQVQDRGRAAHCESAPSKNNRVNNFVFEADPLCGKFCVGVGVGVIVSVSVNIGTVSVTVILYCVGDGTGVGVGEIDKQRSWRSRNGEEAQKDREEASKRERLEDACAASR
jgi:hypothetical protein